MSKFFKVLIAVLGVIAVSLIGFVAYFLIGGDRSKSEIEKEKAASFEFKEVPSSSEEVITSKSSEVKKIVAESETPKESPQPTLSTTTPPQIEAAPEINTPPGLEQSESATEKSDFTSDIENIKGQYPDTEVIVIGPDGTENKIQ